MTMREGFRSLLRVCVDSEHKRRLYFFNMVRNYDNMLMCIIGYKHYGINRGTHEGKSGLWYREWAPGAKALALVGN